MQSRSSKRNCSSHQPKANTPTPKIPGGFTGKRRRYCVELDEHWEKQPEPIQLDSHHLQAAVVVYRGEKTCPHSTPSPSQKVEHDKPCSCGARAPGGLDRNVSSPQPPSFMWPKAPHSGVHRGALCSPVLEPGGHGTCSFSGAIAGGYSAHFAKRLLDGRYIPRAGLVDGDTGRVLLVSQAAVGGSMLTTLSHVPPQA